MSKLRKFLAVAAVVGFTGPALADTWQVFEGPQGSTRGQWTVEIAGNGVSGQAVMSPISGPKLTYTVAGTLGADGVALKRTSSSDGSACSYSAKPAPDGKGYVGSRNCSGTVQPWTVFLVK